MESENKYIETDLGNVAPNPRGEYDPAAAYEYLDLVEYGGGSYLCIQESGTVTGVAPTQNKNTDTWQVLTIPGDLTAEYIAMHDDVVNKAESAQTDAASTAADREQVAGMLANVEQLHTQTETAAQEASDSRDSAAGYAAAAEASRTAAADSEKNAQLQVAGFNETVNAAKQETTEEITTARKTAVQAVAAQQVKSVNAVNAAGSAAIEKTSADAREATAAAEQAKNNKQSAETAAAAAKTSAAAAETAQKAVEGAAGQIETNTAGIEALKEDKVDKPSAADDGKIPRAKEGGVEWVDVGQPTDDQTADAVNKWLDKHPEATTTVQNGVIIEQKIADTFLPYIKKDYVTPEMFGAVGDGVTDDSNAIEQALSSNKNIIMKSGATYKICRAIFPNTTKIHIDGCGAKITADDTFSYTKNECYAFFQFQVNAKNLTEFAVKNLDIDIKTNGILYGERITEDERFCPIFRIKNAKTILIDNCNWVVMSDTGNRAIVWIDGVCDERVSITNSNFENKCAGNAGGVIAIRMRNDLKDITSFMANCSLITDSRDELYSIQNTGASNLYSTIESCVFINHGGFINNKSTKKTIIVATNHTGTGKLYMDINATKIEYDGQSTDLMNSALKLSSTTHAHQNITMRGCIISNPYGRAIEGAFSEQGSQEYLHINIDKCDIIGGKGILNDVIDSIGDIIITDCNIEGESYVSYFYPLNYTNRFIMKNSKVHLKNPEGILYVTNKKRHIVEICGNIYSADYISKAYGNDAIDPNAPNIDLEVIQNNVYTTT